MRYKFKNSDFFSQKISGEVIVSSIPKNLEVGVIGRILGIVCNDLGNNPLLRRRIAFG
jgi:hypothetical protein